MRESNIAAVLGQSCYHKTVLWVSETLLSKLWGDKNERLGCEPERATLTLVPKFSLACRYRSAVIRLTSRNKMKTMTYIVNHQRRLS